MRFKDISLECIKKYLAGDLEAEKKLFNSSICRALCTNVIKHDKDYYNYHLRFSNPETQLSEGDIFAEAIAAFNKVGSHELKRRPTPPTTIEEFLKVLEIQSKARCRTYVLKALKSQKWPPGTVSLSESTAYGDKEETMSIEERISDETNLEEEVLGVKERKQIVEAVKNSLKGKERVHLQCTEKILREKICSRNPTDEEENIVKQGLYKFIFCSREKHIDEEFVQKIIDCCCNNRGTYYLHNYRMREEAKKIRQRIEKSV
jgi:hypothetical protein